MLAKLKSYMMPIAMLIGIVFYPIIRHLNFVTPYLIFTMLLFTFVKISLKEIRFSMAHVWLLLFQIVGSALSYFALLPINEILAQSVMLCFFAPTATAAPVIAGVLGGNIASLTAYSLLCNAMVVILAPLFFSYAGSSPLPFVDSVVEIFSHIAILLLVPFVLAAFLRKFTPQASNFIKKHSGISFYLWVMALTIVTGRTADFVVSHGWTHLWLELIIAFCTAIVCALQFWLVRKIGRKYNDTVAGGQGLGQKNTVLAIWMSQSYLNPLSSIGPGAYIVWQNIVNSYQVWKIRKNL
jgi:BASS family bile acid:Na+ symporter